MTNNKKNNYFNKYIKKDNKESNNNIIIQVTLFDKDNKHKPISTLVDVESMEWYKHHSKEVKEIAIQKICNKRYMTGKELVELGYTIIKVRNYSLWLETNKK